MSFKVFMWLFYFLKVSNTTLSFAFVRYYYPIPALLIWKQVNRLDSDSNQHEYIHVELIRECMHNTQQYINYTFPTADLKIKKQKQINLM